MPDLPDRQVIDIGTAPDDGTGDTLREAGAKTNANTEALWDNAESNADAVVQARAWAISADEPDPTGYPGLESSKTYADQSKEVFDDPGMTLIRADLELGAGSKIGKVAADLGLGPAGLLAQAPENAESARDDALLVEALINTATDTSIPGAASPTTRGIKYWYNLIVAAVADAANSALAAFNSAATATAAAAAAAAVSAVLGAVASVPGWPSIAILWRDKTAWFYMDPDDIKHKLIDLFKTQIATMQTALLNIPNIITRPGAAFFGFTDKFNVPFASIEPGLGGWKHDDPDDFRRRIYLLEVYAQADPVKWGVLAWKFGRMLLALIGQSLSRGHGSYGPGGVGTAYSTTFPPAMGLMFAQAAGANGRVRVGDLNSNPATTMVTTVPLVEYYSAAAADVTAENGTLDAETSAAGFAAMYQQLLQDEGRKTMAEISRRILAFCAGRGGTYLSDMIPTNDVYGRHALLRTGIDRGRTVSASENAGYEVGLLLDWQGEAETALVLGNAMQTNWKANKRLVRTNAEAYAQAQTGQVLRPLPLIFPQIACHRNLGKTPTIAIFQAEMSRDEDMYNTFYTGMLPRSDGIHTTGIGSYWGGAVAGWMWYRWAENAVKMAPLLHKAEISGDQLVITLPTQERSCEIKIDTVDIPLQTQFGITATLAGVNQVLGGQRVVDGRSIVFDCAPGTLAAGWKVQMGYAGDANLGLHNIMLNNPETIKTIGKRIARRPLIWEVTI